MSMDGVIRILGTYPAIQFEDRGGAQSRHASTLKLLRQTFERYSSFFERRQFNFFICSFDNPESANLLAEKTPYVLTYSVTPQCRANILAMPDFAFGGWPEIGIDSYEATTTAIYDAGIQPPIHDQLFWIGNTAMDESRETLVQLGQQHPDLMRCIAMQWQDVPADRPLQPTAYVSLPDHCAYASLIDVRGRGYSGRLKFLMFANRPVFIAERRFHEYYFPYLRPWEHFIPVKADLSDLLTQIAIINADPERARQLGHNAAHFAQSYLTLDYAMIYLRDLLLKISTI